MKPTWETADGRVKLYLGDCLEVLPTLEAGSVDAVVTDPPYNVGYRYSQHDDSMPEPEYLHWLKSRFIACGRAMNDEAPLLWFWQSIRLARSEVAQVLPIAFDVHHVCGWFKSEFAGDLFKGAHPAFCWEPIIWATRGTAVYYGPRGGHAARDMLVGISPRHDKVVGHPCPKPLKIVRTAMEWVSPPLCSVLDPFMGSGTTIIAAIKSGRTAIGIENDPAYFDVARARVESELSRFPLFDAPTEQREFQGFSEKGSQ